MFTTSGSLRPRLWLLTYTLIVLLLVAGLAWASQVSYLLFHTLVELAVVFVALTTFVVAVNTYPLLHSNVLVYLGCGYLAVGLLDLAHLLSFPGLAVLPVSAPDASIQFWLGARALEVLALLSAPLFLRRRLCLPAAIAGFLGGAGAFAAWVFSGGLPAVFIPGEGLTPAKLAAAYLIIALLVLAGAHLWQRRAYLDPGTLRLLLAAVGLTILAELAFTLYLRFEDLSNVLGHVLKLMSYGLIFAAVVQTTLSRPFSALAREATTYEAVPDPTVIVDRRGLIRQLNTAALALAGGQERDLLGRHCHDVFHDTTFPAAECPVCRHLRESATPARVELPVREGWLEVVLSPIVLAGTPHAMVHVARDITQRTQAEFEMRRLSSALAQTDDLVIITDRQGVIEYVNAAFERITGYRREEVLGSRPRMLRSAYHDDAFCDRLWSALESGRPFRDVFINRRKDGTLYYEETTITPLRDEHGRTVSYVSTGKDISERMQVQEQLRHLAHHDPLTGLPNRTLLEDRVEHALAAARRDDCAVAVLFFDLDRFKVVNDSLGHSVGDDLLRMAAERLGTVLRDCDTLARLGGDEFVLVVERLSRAADAAAVAQKLLSALAEPFMLQGFEVFATASIGISVFPEDGAGFADLLKHADVAMYRAKQAGGDSYQFYTEGMNGDSLARLDMRSRLRRALDRGEFVLHYQPRVNLETGAVTGAEALLRWNSPHAGLVSPERFIPVLEETGLINTVGAWVLRTACQQAVLWQAAGLPPLRVSVNLSARQFREHSLLRTVQAALVESGLEPRALELEITEGTLVENVERVVDTLRSLHRLGVSIAVDDFGTGYSSLSYLKRFPIDTLKIDRSFVEGVPADVDNVAIATAIIAMAGSLRLRVTAEGVETHEQLAFLHERRCAEGQGYLFSRPLPPAEFEAWLVASRGMWARMSAPATA